MRKCILYVTTSLDGFLADAEGGTAWMSGAPGSDYGFAAFLASVSSIVMGRRTYERIVELASSGYFPYEDKELAVITSRTDLPVLGARVRFLQAEPLKEVARMKLADDPASIWVAGGAETAGALLDAGLIEEVRIFTLPISLGAGRSLFAGSTAHHGFELETTETWPGGVVESRYRTVRSWRVDIEPPVVAQ